MSHDLTPLGPGDDPQRRERRIEEILRLAAPELARRAVAGAEPETPVTVLSDWAGPGLRWAPLLAAAAIAGLLLTTAPATEGDRGLAAAILPGDAARALVEPEPTIWPGYPIGSGVPVP